MSTMYDMSGAYHSSGQGYQSSWPHSPPQNDGSCYDDAYMDDDDDCYDHPGLEYDERELYHVMDCDEPNERLSEPPYDSTSLGYGSTASSDNLSTASPSPFSSPRVGTCSTPRSIHDNFHFQSEVRMPDDSELQVFAAKHNLEPPRPCMPFGMQYHFPSSGRVTCEAHQPVPPMFQSKYSELTPHLDFMKKLEEAKHTAAQMSISDEAPTLNSPSSNDAPPTTVLPTATPPVQPRSQGRQSAQRPILPSTARPKTKKGTGLLPPAAAAATRARPRSTLFIRTDPATGKVIGSRARETAKKPSLACKFCRERKIACGRPPEDAEDQTCNQCARRQFKCEYRAADVPRRRSTSAQARK